MAKYTIENVEYLRSAASGMGYEEAVRRLEAHDGDMTRVLVDLEREGRIKGDAPAGGQRAQNEDNPQSAPQGPSFAEKAKTLFDKCLNTMFVLRHGEHEVVRIPVLVSIPILLCAPKLVLALLIVALATGCRVRFVKLRRAAHGAAQVVEDKLHRAADEMRKGVESLFEEEEV